jgi:hypothetical protein
MIITKKLKMSKIQDGATTAMGADRVTGSASRASPRGSLNACRGVFAADRQSGGEVVLVLTTSQVTLNSGYEATIDSCDSYFVSSPFHLDYY